MPILLLHALLHLYVGLRLGSELPVWGAVLLGLLLTASALLIPLSFFARRLGLRIGEGVSWGGLLAMGLFSSLFVLTLLREATLLAVWAAERLGTGTWPQWDERSAVAVIAGALLMSAWGFLNARRTARVRQVELPVADLPAGLAGFRIAQISDVHVGPTIRRGQIDRIVAAVNRLQADMVAVTGDLVDGSVRDLAIHVAPLAGLQARHGVFFVTGNHEYYSGAPAWIAELRRLGMTVLMNEHVVLDHGGARLVVAGVADWSAHHFEPSHRSDPKAALAGAPPSTPRVLLAHQPRSAEAAAQAGFDVQLSGHTHGGQFWPWVHFVRFQQPFTAGLHRLRQLVVYVSRGTGYWGPPKRFGAPSEITLLRLVPGRG